MSRAFSVPELRQDLAGLYEKNKTLSVHSIRDVFSAIFSFFKSDLMSENRLQQAFVIGRRCKEISLMTPVLAALLQMTPVLTALYIMTPILTALILMTPVLTVLCLMTPVRTALRLMTPIQTALLLMIRVRIPLKPSIFNAETYRPETTVYSNRLTIYYSPISDVFDNTEYFSALNK